MTIVMLRNGICTGLLPLLGPRTNNTDMVVSVDEKVAQEEGRETEDKRKMSPARTFLGRQGGCCSAEPFYRYALVSSVLSSVTY